MLYQLSHVRATTHPGRAERRRPRPARFRTLADPGRRANFARRLTAPSPPRRFPSLAAGTVSGRASQDGATAAAHASVPAEDARVTVGTCLQSVSAPGRAP